MKAVEFQGVQRLSPLESGVTSTKTAKGAVKLRGFTCVSAYGSVVACFRSWIPRAAQIVDDLAGRLANRVQITTDGPPGLLFTRSRVLSVKKWIVRKHQTIKTAPPVAAGVISQPMTMDALMALFDEFRAELVSGQPSAALQATRQP